MKDSLVLFLASRRGQPVAGALNLLGPDCLYGRYWGCSEDIPFLHFELCYYQAIDFAIGHRLARVEAGAQGEHKLARGYAPVPTYSAHYIADPGFRRAIADFLDREREAVAREIEFLGEVLPFKKLG
jgi:predicted N-acyltransferase